MKNILAASILLFLVGCAVGPAPQRGGSAGGRLGTTNSPPVFSLTQGDNPAAASVQNIKREITKEWETAPQQPQSVAVAVTNNGAVQWVVIPINPSALGQSPVRFREHTTETIGTELGAAQKDTAREIGAKLASMKPVQFFGMALFVAGLLMLHPKAQLVLQSKSLAIGTIGGGVLCIMLPVITTSVPEWIWGVLVLGVVAAIGVYFFAHRHGRLQGFVDANKDGIDDRTQERKGDA